MNSKTFQSYSQNIPSTETDLSLAQLTQSLVRQWKAALAVTIAVFGVSCGIIFTKTPEYVSETLILLTNSSSRPDLPDISITNIQGFRRNDLSTEILVLQSQAMIGSAIKKLIGEFEVSIPQVINNMSITQAGIADVLIVSYQDTDPARTQAVLEVLGQTYVNYSLERQKSPVTNAIQFINQQLPKAQKELTAATEELLNFRQTHGIIDYKVYGTQVSHYKQELLQKIDQLKVALSATETQYRELQNQLRSAGEEPAIALVNSVLSDDRIYQRLEQEGEKIATEYSLERTRFQDSFPLLEDLRLRQEEIENLLQQRKEELLANAVVATETEEEVSGFGRTKQDLARRMLAKEIEMIVARQELAEFELLQESVSRNLDRIPQLQLVYINLLGQLELKSKTVNNFLEQLQELNIAEAQERAPWQVLEPPYLPKRPITPNVQRSLVISGIIALLLGVGTAWLLDKLDSKVKKVEEVKELTGLPLLGNIPKVPPSLVKLAPASSQSSSFKEAVSSLAINLRYLVTSTGKKTKVLAVTSTRPSEGKTTVTYNLGLVLAEMGYKTLVVDGDMRRPRIQKLAQKDNETGLSTTLVDNVSWSESIDKQGDQVDILTAGPTPPNPITLLSSQRMKQLIQEWRNEYKYVLIDTPPISVSADTLSFATDVDSILFVAAMERATHSGIRYAMETLRGSKCNLAGVVVNLVAKAHQDYSYSSDYYSYYHSNGNSKKGRVKIKK